MGKGAYVCIRNSSTFEVHVTINDLQNIEADGAAELQGQLSPGSQFPASQGTAVENKGSYQYMEGEKKSFIQKDGSFQWVVTVDGHPNVSINLCVDASKWWAEPQSDDTDAAVTITSSIREVDEKFKIDVTVYNAYHGNSWMGDLASDIADTPFCQVCLPGTHDSATYHFEEDLGASPDSDLTMKIQEKLVSENEEGSDTRRRLFGKMGNAIGAAINNTALGLVFERMCKAQSLSVKEQLEYGVRYLDLRVAYHDNSDQFYSCHGVYCVNMDTIINDVNDFLTENSKEIVIMDFNHLYNMEEHHEAFVNKMFSTLGDRVADSTQLTPMSTIGEYWNANAQAIILYQHGPAVDTSGGKLWSQDHIHSPWPEANDLGVLESKLVENVKGRSIEHFFVLQGILTPDGDLIKEELLESNINMSLASIASRASPKVVEWVEEWKGEKHNVVIVDYIHECTMVPLLISMNRK